MRAAPFVCAFLILATNCGPVLAQTAPPPAASDTAAEPQAASASLGHAALKGVTLKLINGVAAMAVFSTGTGSLVAGGALATVVAITSYTVFVVNDYVWDHYFPNTNVAANNESFNPLLSLGRNTAKFLTFKPAVVTADWTMIYLYTGSLASTLTMGSAYSILSPLTFYANNVAWDWLDWYSTGGQPQAAQPR